MATGKGPGDSPRRVVVTGMGLISPVGRDVATSWESLLAGKSGGGKVTAWEATDDFPCRIGCEANDFDPLDYMEKRDAKRFDRVAQFALGASAQALGSAGLETLPAGLAPERIGVVFGSGIGGIATFEEQHRPWIRVWCSVSKHGSLFVRPPYLDPSLDPSLRLRASIRPSIRPCVPRFVPRFVPAFLDLVLVCDALVGRYASAGRWVCR